MSENKENITKSETALREEKVLEFWKENKIFEKTINRKDNPKGDYIFYEGPPTANGKPGIHHLEARSFKDVVPRYKTMQGFHVGRKGGWDTHGLPVELAVEKALGLKSKKEIENYGVKLFNQKCKENVWEYLEFWNKFTERMGYWIDQENPYVTYENSYIEALWGVVKKINDRGFLYKDFKVLPWCTRCGTALSSHELSQPGAYKDVKDLSVYIKFKIKNFDHAYFLAWTTTPWTLPGNVGLAVGNDFIYVEAKVGDEILVLAKERLEILNQPYEIIAEHKGSEMIGMEYEPLFPYLKDLAKDDEKIKNAFKIYGADFVTTTDGTGIVHTAVMYGADDFELGTKVGLPKYHTVNEEGKFVIGTDFLAGRYVKETDENGKPTLAVDIINHLTERSLLFKKENYMHSYPHCWRCDTPLIYYARSSWYFRMSALREQLLAGNEKINWEPEYIKKGRFGEWLDGIKDWAISRDRYWGTPIPVWQKEDGSYKVVGSLADLKKYTKKSGNKYFVMRHGETEANKKNIICTQPSGKWHLDKDGKEQVEISAEFLKDKKIDLIFTSDFTRTIETAEIVAQKLGLNKENIIKDERLREIGAYSFDGKNWEEYHKYHIKTEANFNLHVEDDESYQDVKNRMTAFLYDVEEKYKDKNILFVTHGGPAWLLCAGIEGKNVKETLKMILDKKDFHFFQNAEIKELDFVPLPHNANYELDFHKPYIDEIVLEDNGQKMIRTGEVMDVWFDSGAMPYAQNHILGKEIDFNPIKADYISEAIDQTRGWFYTLHAVINLLSDEPGNAYKNVVCLGHILDANGQKMSKSKGNVVDPWLMFEKYGADTIRLWMYSVNQPGESKNFDERTVMEIHRQFFGLLYNVVAFYELYRDPQLEVFTELKSENILDQWILARLNELNKTVTDNLDNYRTLEPVRAVRDFIDDLSTWYLRRSRERIKNGDIEAKQTLYFVLKNLVKIMAPFAPFASEDIWQKLKNKNDVESVHLAEWPEVNILNFNDEILENMKQVREIVSSGLKERQKSGIPVRQPLSNIQIFYHEFNINYIEILKEELNIKNVEFIKSENVEDVIKLDTEITPELKIEGNYRELVRAVQDMRKTKGLMPSDLIVLKIDTDEKGKEIINKFKDEFLKIVGVKQIDFTKNDGNEIKINELVFKVVIE
ncbi:class I tRNA ligase family protein [Candidatus Nomurabacteria bacterium]|nr:class I tRNA ligase family protein [Candidatus Nomurabacteria bacterium]